MWSWFQPRRIWALLKQQIPSELTLPNTIQESRKFLNFFSEFSEESRNDGKNSGLGEDKGR